MKLSNPMACLVVSMGMSGPASAADVRVVTAGSFRPILTAVAAGYEREHGHKLVITADTAAGLKRRVEGGEAFDVVIAPPAVLADLVADQKAIAGSSIDVAKIGVGVAVKEGAPRPAMATVEDFKAAVFAARHVAYVDPALGSSSGVYLAGLIDRLGLAHDLRSKSVLVTGGSVAQRLVTGEADLAIHQISEILTVEGAELVGPLPDEIQNYTVYAAGLGSAAAEVGGSKALIDLLANEATSRILTENGMEAPNP